MGRGAARNQRSDPRRLARGAGIVQGPPLQTRRNQLNISPIVQTIRDRQAARQGFYEEAGDLLLNGRPGLFAGANGIYENVLRGRYAQARRPLVAHPAASAAQTWRQFDDYQSLRAATELETDAFERNITVGAMWQQLIYNEWILSQVARNCVPNLPLSSSFQAAIISMVTARRIFGPSFASTTIIRSAPRTSVPRSVGMAVDRLRRLANFNGRPVPEAVVIRREQLPQLFAYFARNPAPAPRWR